MKLQIILGTLAALVTVEAGVLHGLKSQSCTLKAKGHGKDDAPAFLDAVKKCSIVTIPKDTTLNITSKMDMTGIRDKVIVLEGTVSFNPDIAYWTLAGNTFTIPFQNSSSFWNFGGENLVITGRGTLDGQGQAWWDAFHTNSSLLRPIILHTYEAKNVLVEGITMANSPIWFNFIDSSSNVVFENVNISAPTGTPNTDGWDIYRSDSVTIKNSVIQNGDDCVSFKPNSTNMVVSNLDCTGSHGISVGSLGQYSGVFDIVENVLVEYVTMSGAENGARIKAFAGPNVGSGMVKNVTYNHFVANNVGNPVVINQCYETSTASCLSNPSNVIIQDIFFDNISGTGSSATVATLECSPDARCSDINVNNLSGLKGNGNKTTFECENVTLLGNAASLFGTCTTG